MKAKVDKEACVSCGLCSDICPEVFKMGDEVAEVITDDVPEDAEATCKEAKEACPVEAIIVEE